MNDEWLEYASEGLTVASAMEVYCLLSTMTLRSFRLVSMLKTVLDINLRTANPSKWPLRALNIQRRPGTDKPRRSLAGQRCVVFAVVGSEGCEVARILDSIGLLPR